MVGSSSASTNVNDGLTNDYPMGAYIEYVSRDNIADVLVNSVGQANADFFLWGAQGWIQGSSPVLEDDIHETFKDPGWSVYGGGMFNWFAGGDHGNVNYGTIFVTNTLPPSFKTSDYHKYAMLITTDGSSSIYRCSWVDDVFWACSEGVPPYAAVGAQPDNIGSVAQRNVIAIWSGNLNNQDNTSCPGTATWCINSDIHHWIKSVKVYTCADWRRGSTGQNPTCKGGSTLTTGQDGSQFYKVTTQ
jgi:hypothetical protein